MKVKISQILALVGLAWAAAALFVDTLTTIKASRHARTHGQPAGWLTMKNFWHTDLKSDWQTQGGHICSVWLVRSQMPNVFFEIYFYFMYSCACAYSSIVGFEILQQHLKSSNSPDGNLNLFSYSLKMSRLLGQKTMHNQTKICFGIDITAGSYRRS